MLSDSYHVLAPDYPAFGLTKVADDFIFNFDNITIVIAAWLKALGIEEAIVFIQDFGAPVGLRLAVTGVLKLTAIISQNGNIYKEGLGPQTFGPLMKFWENYSEDFANMIANKMLTLAGTREHIVKGTPEKDLHLIDPQIWELAYMQNIAGPANVKNKIPLLYDYRTNVEQYPAYQKFVRESKVPILAVWGKNDPSFIPPGAEGFRNDSPDATIIFLDSGHYSLETVRWEIARITKTFLNKIGI